MSDEPRPTLPPEWIERCARHTTPTVARTLQYGFYCEDCTWRLTREAFNQRPPYYHGETVEGACGLCNRRGPVTLRSWFACGICWNVVLAYQKSLVASAAIHKYWIDQVTPDLPMLRIQETEEVRIEPFARRPKTKQQAAKLLTVLDFLVSFTEASNAPEPVFHIEQKTGPGSIVSMKEFQLDVNDYEDIVGACLNTGLPAYVFHVRVGREYENGTRRIVPGEIWWTDVVRLRAHLKRVSGRRGEDKKAAYFIPSAFQPIHTFALELHQGGYRTLKSKIEASALALPGRH